MGERERRGGTLDIKAVVGKETKVVIYT